MTRRTNAGGWRDAPQTRASFPDAAHLAQTVTDAHRRRRETRGAAAAALEREQLLVRHHAVHAQDALHYDDDVVVRRIELFEPQPLVVARHQAFQQARVGVAVAQRPELDQD